MFACSASVFLCSVSSCSAEDVVPFKQAGGSIVPAAETTLSPACPLRMLDWTSVTEEKKKKRNNLHGVRPLSPSTGQNNRVPPLRPPAFPGALLIRSHSGVQI